MSPLDRVHTTSYWRSKVTMTLILCHFWDIQCRIMSWHWNPDQWSLKVIGTDTDQSATYDFLLTFHSIHGPSSYRFWDKRRFLSKITKFSHPPCILCLCWRGSPWIGYRRSGSKKKQNDGATGTEKEVLWYLQPSRYNPTTWQTDRQTDRWTLVDSKDCLRIASNGKNQVDFIFPLRGSDIIHDKLCMYELITNCICSRAYFTCVPYLSDLKNMINLVLN